MTQKQLQSAEKNLLELIRIVARLRNPKLGCPWDLEQNHLSLIPHLLEEAHEVADAIRYKDDKQVCEELGDLLLQIVLHAQIAKEEKRFSINDIAKAINAKLIRRHPHVFKLKEKLSINSAQERWDEIKKSEQKSKGSNYSISNHLRHQIRSQPALAGAMKISKKVSKEGFEWKSIEAVWEKLNEEIQELKSALKNKDKKNAQEELGDVLFTLINIGRWAEINPEESLAGTNQRFLDRFSYIESSLNGKLSGHSITELLELWKEAKTNAKKIN